MKRGIKIFVVFLSFFLFSVSYSQTNTDIDDAFLVSEARNKEEFIKKLNAMKDLTMTGEQIVFITCQKFDSLKGGSVNCDPAVLSNIQKKLDDLGIKRFRVANLSQASLPPLDIKTLLKLKALPRGIPHALKFPVGYPVYATMALNFFQYHKDYENYNYFPSLCYLNNELQTEFGYEGKAMIPTEDNIVSFVEHLNGIDGSGGDARGCDKRPKAVKHKTEFLLQYPRW